VYTTLHTALQFAVEQGLIFKNPADHVKHAQREERPPTVWTAEQTRRFISACLADGHRCCQLLALKPYTGARLTDLIDAEDHYYLKDERVLLVPKGKTTAARRPLPLVQEAVAILDLVVEETKRERASEYWSADAKFKERWLFETRKVTVTMARPSGSTSTESVSSLACHHPGPTTCGTISQAC